MRQGGGGGGGTTGNCDQWRNQSKISGGAKLHRLVQWRTQDSARGGHNQESGGSAPSRHGFLGFLQEKHFFQRSFLSKKDAREPPSGLNSPLLALLVDLRYCIKLVPVFVCRFG